jgi:hypothetical protein
MLHELKDKRDLVIHSVFVFEKGPKRPHHITFKRNGIHTK